MTTQHPKAADEIRKEHEALPDPPEGDPEDMTSFEHLAASGNVRYLIQHLGNPETTIVAGERYLTREPGVPASERMAPDLLIAFNVEPETYRENNSYIISEQGGPPDFVLEIASQPDRWPRIRHLTGNTTSHQWIRAKRMNGGNRTV